MCERQDTKSHCNRFGWCRSACMLTFCYNLHACGRKCRRFPLHCKPSQLDLDLHDSRSRRKYVVLEAATSLLSTVSMPAAESTSKILLQPEHFDGSACRSIMPDMHRSASTSGPSYPELLPACSSRNVGCRSLFQNRASLSICPPTSKQSLVCIKPTKDGRRCELR